MASSQKAFKMLNIVILDQQGETHGLAARLAQKGHIVKLWSEQPPEQTHKPLFGPRSIDKYEAHVEAADLLISNNPRTGGVAERVRESGRMALGGRVQEQLVEDQWQLQIADMLGLPLTQETANFGLYGLYDGQRWKAQFLVHYYNRMVDGERGPVTSGMGCLAKPIENSALNLLNEFLQGLQLSGFFGLKIYDNGVRLALGSFQTFLAPVEFAAIAEVIRGDDLDVLYSMLQSHKEADYLPGMLGAALRVVYLDTQDTELQHTPEAWKHFWPENQSGLLGIGSARGYKLSELRSRIFRTIESLATPGSVYRTDLGYNIKEFEHAHSQASSYKTADTPVDQAV